jgi:hypothetical protein
MRDYKEKIMATPDETTPAQKVENVAKQVSGVGSQDASHGAPDLGTRVQSKATELSDGMRSAVHRIDEATLPDTFRKMPKLISPRIHAWLDVAVTCYFGALGVWFALRGKRRPATAAFVNAGMVAGVSLLTDYEGTGKKPINFKLHGTLDAVQATKAALGPILYDFADEPESVFFYGQAANELAVMASTDWDEGMPAASNRRAA